MFDEAALTDDLLVELVEVLKRHKQSANKNKETETAKEKEKETSEGKMCAVLWTWPRVLFSSPHKLCRQLHVEFLSPTLYYLFVAY